MNESFNNEWKYHWLIKFNKTDEFLDKTEIFSNAFSNKTDEYICETNNFQLYKLKGS
jgi:hypothetical protein